MASAGRPTPADSGPGPSETPSNTGKDPTGTDSAISAFSTRIVNLQKRRDNLDTTLDAAWIRPAFDMGSQYHPKNLLFNEHRRQMYYAYQYGAAPALAEYLYRYAASKYLAGDAMWDYFAKDKSSPKPILAFLISTMHPDVVRALICGNLTYRYHNDTGFRHTVQRTTNPKEVVGIYMLQWYNIGHDQDAQTQPSTGPSNTHSKDFAKGFSLNDWIDLKEDLKLYLSVGGNDLAKNLDRMFIPQETAERKVAFNDNLRLFAQNNHQRQTIQEFCDMIEKKLEKIALAASRSERDEPAEFSPALVGYGAKCVSRARDHLENKATSALFGLVNCDVKYRFKGSYALQMYQLLYICDPSHRNLAEALCSVLASSYHDELGFNGKRGGAIGSQPDHTAISYRRNIDQLFGWGPASPGGARIQSISPEARGWIRSQEHTKACLERLDKYRDSNKPSLDTLQKAAKQTVEEIDELLVEAKEVAAKLDTVIAFEKFQSSTEKDRGEDKRKDDPSAKA